MCSSSPGGIRFHEFLPLMPWCGDASQGGGENGSYLHPSFWKVDPGCQLIAGLNIWVVGEVEDLLQLMQLLYGKGGSDPSFALPLLWMEEGPYWVINLSVGIWKLLWYFVSPFNTSCHNRVLAPCCLIFWDLSISLLQILPLCRLFSFHPSWLVSPTWLSRNFSGCFFSVAFLVYKKEWQTCPRVISDLCLLVSKAALVHNLSSCVCIICAYFCYNVRVDSLQDRSCSL